MKSGTFICGVLLMGGCTVDRWQFSDSVDIRLDFEEVFVGLMDDPTDALATPYVAGSEFYVFVHDRKEKELFEGFSLQVTNPDVLEIVEGDEAVFFDTLFVRVRAIGEGVSDLELLDSGGEVIDVAPIEVGQPDTVELHFSGRRFLNRSDLPSLAEDILILEEGTATYQAICLKDGERLHGNGVLTAAGSDGLSVQVDRTFLFEDRDWLVLSPDEAGSHSVDLAVNDAPVQTVSLEGVSVEDLARVEIRGQDESDAEPETWLVVLAESFTEEDRPVHGVEYTWDVSGETEAGQGDLYRYSFDPNQEEDLSAHFDEHSADAVIHSGGGFVDSSNSIECSVVGAAGSMVLWFPALVLIRRRS